MQCFVVPAVVLVIFALSVQSRNEDKTKEYCEQDRSDVFYFNKACYLFAHDDMSYGEGRSIFATGDNSCYHLLSGSNLLTIGNKAEHEFIEGILAEKKTWCVAKPCWIGLRFEIPSKELDVKDGWRWSDGNKVGFIPTTKYHLPNPQNGTEEQFISFIPNSSGHSSLTRFNNREANTSLQFICERNVGRNKTNCTNINEDTGTCFVYVKEKLNYSKAVEKCLSLSASLVSIETDDEKAFLIRDVTREYNVEIWTSLKFNSTLELWIWNTTGKELSITFETYQLNKTNDKENHSRCASLLWNNEGNYSFVTNVYSEKCYSKLNYWCKGEHDPNNQCLKTKCFNGGTCIDGYWTHTCQCTDEWEGDLCQYRSTCQAEYHKDKLLLNLCVKVYKGAMKYRNASSHCEQTKNAHIMGKEYINLRGLQNTIINKPVWYGLIWNGNATGPRHGEIDNWKWILDNSTSYLHSQAHFRKKPLVSGNLTEQSCFFLHVTFEVVYFKQAESCNQRRRYICEYYRGSGACTPKYDEDTCYLLHNDLKTKLDAEKDCEANKGFLVDFEREIETTIFLSKFREHDVIGAWIGLTVIYSTYVWSKHSDYMPNGKLGTGLCDHKFTVTEGQKKTCVIDYGRMHAGQCLDLLNVNCDEEYGFICAYRDNNDCVRGPPKCRNGRCIPEFHGFRCDCSGTDFSGTYCDIQIDDCIGNKCEHWSKCVDQIRDYTCKCLHTEAFTGDRCEIGPCERTPNLCQNNGICVNALEDPFYICRCLEKITGKHCTEREDDDEGQNVFEILVPILVVVVSFLVSGGLIHFIIQYQKRQKMEHKTQGSEELESEFVKETVWERVRVVKEVRRKVGSDSVVKEEGSKVGKSESVVNVAKSKLGESKSVVKEERSKVGSECMVKAEGSKVGENKGVVKVDIEQKNTRLELGKENRVGSSIIKTDVNDDNNNSSKALHGDDDCKDAVKDKDKEKPKHQDLCVKHTDLQPCDEVNDSIKEQSGVDTLNEQ